MNDSLIIGCVLALVFGALFYYLHSRLAYSEKRVNVMETILLDFKNASEQLFSSGGGYTAPATYEEEQGQAQTQEQTQEQVQQELVEEQPPQQPQQPQHQSQHQAPLVADLEGQPQQLAPSEKEQYHSSNITRNYTSMIKADLVKEALSRNIPGATSMNRKKLEEALKEHDHTTAATIAAPPSELTDLAEELSPQ